MEFTISSTSDNTNNALIWQEKLEKQLFEAGLTLDLSSDSTVQELLHPDQKNGSVWYPGFFANWFQSKLGYKDHETFTGYHELCGPVILSIFPYEYQSKGYVKALVRTCLGFHIVEAEEPRHQRTPSTVQKLKNALTSNSIPVSKIKTLEAILRTYFAKVKRIHCSSVRISKDSGLASVSDDQLNSLPKETEIWGSKKPADFFNHISVSEILNGMEQNNHPGIAKNLYDLELPSRATTFMVDVLNVKSGDTDTDADWLSFLNQQLGIEDSEVSNQKLNTSKNKKDGDDLMRQHCILDFIEKENNYVSDLVLVQEGMLTPLSKTTNILTKHEFNQLPKLSEIISINSELLSDLKKAKETDEIGKCLLKYPERLKKYSVYVKSHAEKTQTFKEFIRTKPEFKKFVQQSKADSLKKKLDFEDVLISPVQKIPRYALILKELLKYTREDHTDYMTLKECLSQFNSLVEYLDQGIDKEKAMIAIMEINRTVEGCPPDFVKSSRFLIDKFEITEVTLDLQPVRTFQMYLLSDAILLAEVRKKKDKMRFYKLAELSSVEVVSLADRGHYNVFQMEIFSSSHQFEQKNVIVLGGSGQESLSRNLSHIRSASTQSSLNASQYTLKSSEHLLGSSSGSKDIVLFQTNQTPQIMQSLKKQKHKLKSQAVQSSFTHFTEIDSNNDICFNVYSDYQAYKDSPKKHPILVAFIDQQCDCESITRTEEVQYVVMCKSDQLSKNYIVRSIELLAPSVTEFHSESRKKDDAIFSRSNHAHQSSIQSKISNLCLLSDSYSPKVQARSIETYQILLQKIYEKYGRPTQMKANASTLSLVSFKNLKAAASSSNTFGKSHSRRGSGKSIVADESKADSTGDDYTTFTMGRRSSTSTPKRRGSLMSTLTKSLGFGTTKSTSSSISNEVSGANALIEKLCDFIEESYTFVPNIYQQPVDDNKCGELVQKLLSGFPHDQWKNYSPLLMCEAFKLLAGLHRGAFGDEAVMTQCAQKFANDEKIDSCVKHLTTNVPSNHVTALVRLAKHLKVVSDAQSDPGAETKIIEAWSEAISPTDEFEMKDFVMQMLKYLSRAASDKCGLQWAVGEGTVKSADAITAAQRPKHFLEPRRSLDGLAALARSPTNPPVSSIYGNSLTSIDEGFQSCPVDSPLKERKRRSSLFLITTSGGLVSRGHTPSHSRTSSRNVPRKPVQYNQEANDDGMSLAVNKPTVASNVASLPITSTPEVIVSPIGGSPVLTSRRSVSMPVKNSLALQESLMQAMNAGRNETEKQCQKMSSEIENLKSQLKCLRKALDAELVKKNVPSENQEEWKAVNSSVEEISNACSIQLETTKNAIDVMKSETEKLEGLYEEAVCEIQKLQLRVHELEDQRQQWKSREAELLLQINNHN